jgi:hypothetical protein
MNGLDVFEAAFLVALAVVIVEQVRKHAIDPGLTLLSIAVRRALAMRAGVSPLEPTLAVQRYVSGGLNPERGMPGLAELQWLLSLAPAARFAWATAVLVAFDQALGPAMAADYSLTLDDLGLAPQGPIRAEAHAYLETVSTGFPIVGSWTWSRS